MTTNDVQTCPGQPIPAGDTVPVCGHFAAHFPHPIGESVTYRQIEGDQPFSPLVGAVLTQMFADSATTANTLIDSLQAQLQEALAELYAIRHGVDQLLAGQWMPTPDAIRDAVMYPRKDLVEEFKNRKQPW